MLSKYMEKYNKDNSASLEKVIIKLTPTFKQIDRFKIQFLKVDSNHTATIKGYLTPLTGYYMELADIHAKICHLKRNKELAFFYSRKASIEAEGTKFVSAPIEKEASLAVADERRTRDIIKGKLDSCIEGIRTCRTLINEKQTEV